MAAPVAVPGSDRGPSSDRGTGGLAMDPDRAKVHADALKRFASLDRDGNGVLTREEFREGLGPMGLDEGLVDIIFNTFDVNGDGQINQAEFASAMAVMLHPTSVEEQVTMAFNAYDTDKDGRLSIAELESVIRSIFSTLHKMGIRDTEDHAIKTKRAAEELYRQLDTEGKGFVTKEDYVQLATANPELLKKLGLGNPRHARSTSRIGRASGHGVALGSPTARRRAPIGRRGARGAARGRR